MFFASDPIAIPVLRWLAGCAGVGRILVVTSPDARAGRGKQLRANAVKAAAVELGLEVLQPTKPDGALVEGLRRDKYRTGFVFAYGHILGRELLAVFEGYLLNFHGSILPRYRGASPVETAIAEGDAETGVSLMQVVRRMDAGPVAAVERVAIGDGVTGPVLRAQLADVAVRCLEKNWEAIRGRSLPFVPQDEAAASYVRRLTKEDGGLDFEMTAVDLERRVRAFAGWPGCWFDLPGIDGEILRIKVGSAEVAEGAFPESPPGVLVGADSSGLRVATGGGVLGLTRLQRPGGRMLSAGEFLRGCPVAVGIQLRNQKAPPLVRPNPSGKA